MRLLVLYPVLASAAGVSLAAPPELRFAAPPGIVSGTVVEIASRLTPGDDPILSWSLSAAVDGLTALDAATAGTDFDELAASNGHAESGVHPDGSAFYSIAVLSFTEPVSLPAGTHVVLRTRCLVARKDPGDVKVLPRDGLQLPGDDRVLTNEVLLEGGSAQAIAAAEATYPITGCAGFALAVTGSAPGSPVAPIDVRRDTPIGVDAFVRVASPDHLTPTGFTLGVAHDPNVLALDDAVIVDAIRTEFVKTDGFARVELSQGGFVASVLSSASDPAVLGPGDHGVIGARYRFIASAPARSSIATAIQASDDLPLGGSAARTLFAPRDALPCERASIGLELVVGLDWWVRGDADGDGTPNLTDAIITLQHLFLGGPAPCKRAMELNLDGKVDISDPIGLLAHLFLGAESPPPPFPACGAAEETLPCDVFPCPAT